MYNNHKKFIFSLFGVVLAAVGIILLLCFVFGIETDNTTKTEVVVMGEIDVNKPMVALTYDDGPYTPVTDRILEALKSVNGRATFFVVGNRIEGREEISKKIIEYGCEIGNHTYTHTRLNSLSAYEIKYQLEETDKAVFELTGYNLSLVRPPEGCYSSEVLSVADRPLVLWSIDTMDWSHQNADKTVNKVLDNVKDGDIVLMHDLFFATAEASERLIPELTSRGFQLVTVSELLKYREKSEYVVFAQTD